MKKKISLANKLNRDMGLVVEEIHKRFDSLEAILLAGSFGRDEGSALYSGDKCQPLNDYDVVVISDAQITNHELNEMRLYLANACGIRQIDIEVKKLKEIPKLKPTMANYDLINASKLIYGSQEIFRSAPKWSSDDLPRWEGIIPLFLFLSSLVQSYPDNHEYSDEQLFWSYQQITKSILFWSTAMLIFENKYDPSYATRCKLFKKLFSAHPELCLLVEEATRFKLQPTLMPCTAFELLNLWHRACNAHLSVLRNLTSKYYKREFDSWEELVTCHVTSPKALVKMLLSKCFKRTHFYDCLNVDIAKLYFCLSVNDKSKQNFCQKYLNKVSTYSSNKDNTNLACLKKEILSVDKNSTLFIQRGPNIFYDEF